MTEAYSYFGLAGENHNHDTRYPAGDTTASTDGYVWTYDAAFGGYLPKAPSGGAGAVDSVDGRTGTVTLDDLYKSAGYVPAYSEITGKPTAFNPTAHKTSHATAGADAIAPTDIGAAASGHAHAKLDRLPDAETTSQSTVYVSPTGSDATGDGSSANRWATIQYAINQAASIFPPANSTAHYRIMCATGVYDQGSADLVIPPNLLAAFNASGQGGMWITSESGVASDVVITSNNTNRAILTFGSATIDRVTVECDRRAVEALGSAANTVFVQDCVLRRKTLANGDAATRAIISSTATLISVRNSSPAGQLYGYGLTASLAGVIGKSGSQPQGAIANESVSGGGVIR